MKIINVIQHLSFEDLGIFTEVLESENNEIHYFQAGVDDLTGAFSSKNPLFILGGPIGVYEVERYPFLVQETALLKQRLERNDATFGICLGAQLIAQALGAHVYAGHHKEIGWSKLQLSDLGLASPLRFLDGVPVLHWHGDTFDLPNQGAHLAGSDYYKNQAFCIGRHILAVQFHPEVSAQSIEKWLIGHTFELNKAQIDLHKLRADSVLYGVALKQAGQLMLKDWLNNLTPL